MSRRVAALYTILSGPYTTMEDVDAWPERRDALLYPAPLPVVAHPPCAPWSRAVAHQTKLSKSQGPWLAPAAVLQVRRWGGILEHPADSMLWEKMSLPYPSPCRQEPLWGPETDAWGGYTLEVYQGSWGHSAPKRTWLYAVGIDRGQVRVPNPPGRALKTDRVRVDKRSPSGRSWRRSAYDLGSPEARKRTPPAFARWLVALAATARPRES